MSYVGRQDRNISALPGRRSSPRATGSGCVPIRVPVPASYPDPTRAASFAASPNDAWRLRDRADYARQRLAASVLAVMIRSRPSSETSTTA
jgi:hypothetical protein